MEMMESETRRIIGLVKDRIAEVAVEQISDQLGHSTPAAAVGHVHFAGSRGFRSALAAHATAASFAFS